MLTDDQHAAIMALEPDSPEWVAAVEALSDDDLDEHTDRLMASLNARPVALEDLDLGGRRLDEVTLDDVAAEIDLGRAVDEIVGAADA